MELGRLPAHVCPSVEDVSTVLEQQTVVCNFQVRPNHGVAHGTKISCSADSPLVRTHLISRDVGINTLVGWARCAPCRVRREVKVLVGLLHKIASAERGKLCVCKCLAWRGNKSDDLAPYYSHD